LFTALDNLIAEHRVPVMMAISIGNGSGDAQGKVRSSDEPCPPTSRLRVIQELSTF
jgi:hypothetical protein